MNLGPLKEVRNTIWKYPLVIADRQRIEMPKGAKILTVQAQDGQACLWALVNADEGEMETRDFVIYGTGHYVSPLPGVYIGTVQMAGGRLVWHVFEEPR